MAWVTRQSGDSGAGGTLQWVPSANDDPNKVWVKQTVWDADNQTSVDRYYDPQTKQTVDPIKGAERYSSDGGISGYGPSSAPTGRVVDAGEWGNLDSEFWKKELSGTQHWLQAFAKLQMLGGEDMVSQAARKNFFAQFPYYNDQENWNQLRQRFGVDQNQGGLWGETPGEFVGLTTAALQDQSASQSQAGIYGTLALLAAPVAGYLSTTVGAGEAAGAAGTTGAGGAAGATGSYLSGLAGAGELAGAGAAAGGTTAAGGALGSLTNAGGAPAGADLNTLGTLGTTATGADTAFGSDGGSGPTSGGDAPSGSPSDGTALSRLLSGVGSNSDWASILGTLGATGLGIYASDQQSDSLERLANQYMAMGAPSRARYESSFAPGFTMANDPGYTDALNQTAKSTLHGMSAKFGNPSDSPNAWDQTLTDLYQKTAYPALQNYRGLNANAGGISTFAGAAPGVSTGAINAERGIYDSIGAGAADIFNPPRRITLQDLMRQYG